MPRYARSSSQTGIYHVMIRGIDKMDIFLENYDKDRFLQTLAKMKAEGEYSLHAYCLMNNHVHLLIKEESDLLQRTMKRICVSYSAYFNRKYERIGHLFQDRFKSESIETDEYMLACTRYIHNNPVKAGIAKYPQNYIWSSYRLYIEKDEENLDLLNREYLMNIFSEDKKRAINMFINYSNEETEDPFMDYSKEKAIKSNVDKLEAVFNIIEKYNLTIEDFKKISDKQKRDMMLRQLKAEENISLRDISNITGISKDIIFRS